MKPADDRSVLIIAPHPFFTERGTPIAVRDIASILTEAGWTVTILTFPFGEDPRLDGVEVIRVGRVPFVRRVGIGLNAGKIMVDIFLWFKLAKITLLIVANLNFKKMSLMFSYLRKQKGRDCKLKA